MPQSLLGYNGLLFLKNGNCRDGYIATGELVEVEVELSLCSTHGIDRQLYPPSVVQAIRNSQFFAKPNG